MTRGDEVLFAVSSLKAGCVLNPLKRSEVGEKTAADSNAARLTDR